MYKVAYLISAYISPASLKNLVEALWDETADFYIHIDKKVKIEPFQDALQSFDRVYFLNDSLRVRVMWGGYSQVLMQYSLIKCALESSIAYTRYVNLTGTDYPVASNYELQEKFERNENEFITGFPISNETGSSFRQRNRAVLFWNMDAPKLIRGVLKLLKIRRYKSYEDIGVEIYVGSEYWGLTDETLRHVVKYYEEHKEYRDFLKHSFVPSEMWIHTVLFNSVYAAKGQIHEEGYAGLISLAPLEFFIYGNEIKILTEDDYDAIKRSGKAFCRKVIDGKSDVLRKKLQSDRR